MYNEICNGIIELLKKGPEWEVKYMKDMEKVPHILSLTYDFDSERIIRIKKLKISGIPNILLVLAFMPEGKEKSQYHDYIMYNGELTKIIVFNMNGLTAEDPMVQLYNLGWAIYKTAFLPIENHIHLFERQSSNKVMYGATNVMYYAPAVLLVQIIERLYGDSITNECIAELVNMFYRANITEEGVKSIKTVLSEVGLESILDYGFWNALDDENYPGAAFAERSDDEEEDSDEDPEQQQED